MKIALVYDRITKWGGAERVLLALHKIWPDAPLYTAVYDKKNAAWADVFEVKPSFLQKIPFANRFHELLPVLTPIAFESFNFDAYDAVISVTSAEAKSIITKPGTVHICYCLTPTRYLWSGYDVYSTVPILGKFLQLLTLVLRKWDKISSSRPDAYIAISERVKVRIKKYYDRDADLVIYPPVNISKGFPLRMQGEILRKKDYFLTVSRLVPYKRIDIIINAFNELRLPLIIIGNGYEKNALKKMAKNNIQFIDHYLTDSELVRYYERCRGFVYAADEDFGIAAAEAQGYGKPVIAYHHSGIAEIVKDGKTGILYEDQTSESLKKAVKKFSTMKFSESDCIENALRFSENHFMYTIKGSVEDIYKKNTL